MVRLPFPFGLKMNGVGRVALALAPQQKRQRTDCKNDALSQVILLVLLRERARISLLCLAGTLVARVTSGGLWKLVKTVPDRHELLLTHLSHGSVLPSSLKKNLPDELGAA